MLRRAITLLSLLSFALLILFVSVFRLASIKYVFSQAPSTPKPYPAIESETEYPLPYPGSIAPDNFLWPAKVLRDKVWVQFSLNPSKKADTLLLIADKRLASSLTLFKQNKPELAASVLTKAEKYLEEGLKQAKLAQKKGQDMAPFLQKFATSALKHKEVMDEMLLIAPEDAKPLIVKTQDYPKRLYTEVKTMLHELGVPI